MNAIGAWGEPPRKMAPVSSAMPWSWSFQLCTGQYWEHQPDGWSLLPCLAGTSLERERCPSQSLLSTPVERTTFFPLKVPCGRLLSRDRVACAPRPQWASLSLVLSRLCDPVQWRCCRHRTEHCWHQRASCNSRLTLNLRSHRYFPSKWRSINHAGGITHSASSSRSV